MALKSPRRTATRSRLHREPLTRGAGGKRFLESDVAGILSASAITGARTDNPVLFLMVGLPGTGKSTMARRLAADTGATIIESDAGRRLLFSPVTHSDNEDRRVWAAIYAAARRLVLRGCSVILDGTSVTESNRRPAYALSAETRVPLLVLQLTASERVVAHRLDERERTERAQGENTDWFDVYRRMASRSQPISREHITIDTSDPINAEAAYQEAVQAWRAAGSAQRD